mmetsp:Transcript_50899/g.69277  ORF Transcript_50899/g.69277 Transcript_50899/m.69277 type:complete len:248 (-) Transcript_50899:79-822(-)
MISNNHSENPLLFGWSGGEPDTFHEIKLDHAQAAENTIGKHPCFNDISYYFGLLSEEGCVRVDIARVLCRHNSFVIGLQVVYRSVFRDGSTRFSEAPAHFFESGFYSYHGGQRETVVHELEDGERIIGLRLCQGEIMDGITFVTNRRTFHSGGMGGHRVSLMCPTEHHRVVAFGGTSRGVLERLTFFAERKLAWVSLGPLVMLRWLVMQQRAVRLPLAYDAEDLGLQTLIGISNYTWRKVLCFLREG